MIIMASDTPIEVYSTPAAFSPAGWISDFKRTPYLQTTTLATRILCLSATTVAVSLRIFTKVHIMKQVHIEDCKLYPTYFLSQLISDPLQMR